MGAGKSFRLMSEDAHLEAERDTQVRHEYVAANIYPITRDTAKSFGNGQVMERYRQPASPE